MTTGDYDALAGSTPEEKLKPLGIEQGTCIDLQALAALAARHGVTVYLFFEEDLAKNVPLERVIRQYKDIPEDMRPYIRIEAFLRFIRENDPTFTRVMANDPILVRIVTTGQIAADPAVPPQVYITGLMPYLDEMDL